MNSSSPFPFLSASMSHQQTNLATINGENGGEGETGVESDHHHDHHQQQVDSNAPVESYSLSKEEEIDWLNKNAFFERKESTRRKSISSNSTSILSSISLKSKPGASSIIGLPKTQKSCFTECKIRKNCKPSKARFFPKKSNRSTKSSVPPPSEPSSPKVSCIGRVRSKKEQRSRSLRIHHDHEETETKNPKPNKTGFWSSFKAVLRIGCQKPNVNERRRAEEEEEEEESPPSPSKKTEKIGRRTLSDPPVFGELKRFTSGRKSDSWGGGELSSDNDAAEFDSSLNRRGGGGVAGST